MNARIPPRRSTSGRVSLPGQLPEGTRIAETYAVRRLLGSGGTGEVYLARDEWLERDVAIKVFLETANVDAYRTELDALTKLNHPNVVEVFDRGIHLGRNFLVMAYLGGRSLRQLLDDNGPLGLVETYRMVEALGAGIDALHRAGLIHGDLKPENILLRPQPEGAGSPVIIDLGFSQRLDARAEKIAGSPAYVAPERLTGDKSQPTSDIYSLALIAHELLTGKAAMARPTLDETLRAHLSPVRPSLPPRAGQSGWPDGLDAVLGAGYALAPAMRPTSARAFRDALYRALEPFLVRSVSARCPHCARSNIKVGEFCGDCGVEGLPTRCPACGNATDPCVSTRCQHCDASLFARRSRGRPSRMIQKTTIGQPAVLAIVGPALGEVALRYGFEYEVQAAGGLLVAEIGDMFVATFERTRGRPTATQIAVAVAQRTLQRLENDTTSERGPQLSAGVECSVPDGGWQGVLHGRLQLGGDAVRTALEIARAGLQEGGCGVCVGPEAKRLLPPGTRFVAGPGAGRIVSLGNTTLRLADRTDRWLHSLSGLGRNVVIMRAGRSGTSAPAVQAMAQGWARENSGPALVVSDRRHVLLEFGIARVLLSNLLSETVDPAERNQRVAAALRADGYTHESAQVDALAIGAILDGCAAEPVGWAPGQMLFTMWRVLDALLPNRVVLAITEAARLTEFALQQLIRLVESRGGSAKLVLGDSTEEPIRFAAASWPVIDADAPLPDAGLEALTRALPRLAESERFAGLVPVLTGGRPSAVQELFSLLSHLESNDREPDQVLDLLVELAQRPSDLHATRFALLNSDEQRCLTAIVALGEDTMLSVLAACMPDLSVAAHIEALSAYGLIGIDYDRYLFNEVALNMLDPSLGAWIEQESPELCSAVRRRAAAACESLHGDISPDLRCRMAKVMVAENDSVAAAKLIRDAADAFETVDPWRALDLYRHAASLLPASSEPGGVSNELQGEVEMAIARLAGRYCRPERVVESLDQTKLDLENTEMGAIAALSRAQSLHRLGWGLEAIPVLEGAIGRLARIEHGAWLLAAICEELAFLLVANGDEAGALRVVGLYHNISGTGPFAADHRVTLLADGTDSIATVFDAPTDTFGSADVILDRRREASSLRLDLLGVIAYVRRDMIGAAERQLAAIEVQIGKHPPAKLAGTLAWAQGSLARATGEEDLATELLIRAVRELRRAGEDDCAVLILAKALRRGASPAADATELEEVAVTLRPEGPDARRRLALLQQELSRLTDRFEQRSESDDAVGGADPQREQPSIR